MDKSFIHNKDLSIEEKVEILLSQMTLEEKVMQLTSVWSFEVMENKEFSHQKANERLKYGIGQITRLAGATNASPEVVAKLANQIQDFLVNNTRLGIPAIIHEEACSGFMGKGGDVFPQAIGVSCSWNPDAVYKMGNVIKSQMKAVGAHQALAPLLDVTRDARWGRVEETFGEDPYLVASMGIAYIKGLQGDNIKDGIVATGKHFVGYGMTEGGMNWAPSHIPERELREVYLFPFEAGVKEAGLLSIMAAYHENDSIPLHAHEYLLNKVLRDEWGFDGIVVSDYFGIRMLCEYHKIAKDRDEAGKIALESGVDIELPTIESYTLKLVDLVKYGTLKEEYLDRAIRRILRLKFMLGLFENPFINTDETKKYFDVPEFKQIVYDVAKESIVLLKNQNNFLPLKNNYKKIAVIGPNANEPRNMIGDYSYPCHIETLLHANTTLGTVVPDAIEVEQVMDTIQTMYKAISEKVQPDVEVKYAKGCDVLGESKEGFEEAINLAKESDVVILCVGDKAGLMPDCTSGESRDRAFLNLPGVQEDLVKEIYNVNKNIVLVLINGRPISIDSVEKFIPAIVEGWLPGEKGADAIADIILGNVNPSGKLSITFPRTVGQVPMFYSVKPSGGRSNWHGDYVEVSVKPLYPFGYGLSYSTFEYSDFEITPKYLRPNQSIKIKLKVTNTSDIDGYETVQVYIQNVRSIIAKPVKQLKGFKKVFIKAHQTVDVEFELFADQFVFLDENMKKVFHPGIAKIMVGSSSQDIHFEEEINLVGEKTYVDDIKHMFSK
ncbi:glycoside hydrolase family 3 N-terminal domain-containing protein [Caldicellulosiruptoraceae bacterium PP1]